VGDDSYSKVVLSAKGLAPTLGISFVGDKRRFLDLLTVLEEGQHRVVMGSASTRRGGGSLKIWNVLLTLMLEAMVLTGVKVGLFAGLGFFCGCLGASLFLGVSLFLGFIIFFFFCFGVPCVYFLCT
jgi:hypothetical protein